jgi:hypothetical protein
MISDDTKSKIFDLRERGWSQARVSELLDVSLSSVKRYWNAPRPIPSNEHNRPTLDDPAPEQSSAPPCRAAPDVFSIPSYLVDGEDVGRVLALDAKELLALARWYPRNDTDTALRLNWLLSQPEIRPFHLDGGDRRERWITPPGTGFPRERKLVFKLDNMVQLKRLVHIALYDAREREDPSIPGDDGSGGRVLAPIYHNWEEGFFTDDSPRQGRGAWSPPSCDAFEGMYAPNGPDWRLDPARHFYRR